MTTREFYNWQTQGGADDVSRAVAALDGAGIAWCAIGGIAVNHWAQQPMVTLDVDLVVAADNVSRAVALLEQAGFRAETFAWSVNFHGQSDVGIQLSTEAVYRDFPARAVTANVHGIVMKVAALADTLTGKMLAWADPARRQSKRLKDLADIARLVESHPHLWSTLTDTLQQQIQQPGRNER